MATRASKGIDLFRIAGVGIRIDYSWFIIFLLVLWSLSIGYFPLVYPGHSWVTYLGVGLVATILFFTSVLVHELSHAMVGNRLGEEVREITLFIFGGMAHLSREPKDPVSEMKIAGIGPVTSLVLAFFFWCVARLLIAVSTPTMWVAVFDYLALINVALAVFNLLPGFPLDGGRLARAIFWYRSGDLRRATERAANWGSGIAIGLMVFGALEIFAGALVGGIWLILIGMFLRGAAQAGYQGMVTEQILGHTRVGDIMVRDPITIDPEATVADAVENYFLRYGHGGFPVVADGRAEGLLSLRQVQQCAPEERTHRRVREVMRRAGPEIETAPRDPVSTALRRMMEGDTGRLLVVEGDRRLAGLITRTGIGRHVQLSTLLEPEVAERAA